MWQGTPRNDDPVYTVCGLETCIPCGNSDTNNYYDSYSSDCGCEYNYYDSGYTYYDYYYNTYSYSYHASPDNEEPKEVAEDVS